MNKTAVLLADEDGSVRAGLRAIIDAEPDLAVVGEVGDGADLLAHIRFLRPDVVLMDVRMPSVDGVQASRQIRATLAAPPKVLVVTSVEDDDHVYAALRAGADGFVHERTRPEDIVRAVRMVVSGESMLLPRKPGRVAGLAAAGLTEREAEVLRLMATGLSNVEIGAQLFVSVQTVKTHVGNVLAKLGARDRTQAVILAYETGFVTPG